MDVALQIHHLDDGEEADIVASALEETASRAGMAFERPTEDTNAAFVRGSPVDMVEEWQALSVHLTRMQGFLACLQPKDLDPIRERGLNITLRICHAGFNQLLEPPLLKECGRLNVSIQIFNDKLFMDGVVSH